MNQKTAISVTEMSKDLGLSRARFYQLLNQGIFPKPLYSEETKRPFYDLELQKNLPRCSQDELRDQWEADFVLFGTPTSHAEIQAKAVKEACRVDRSSLQPWAGECHPRSSQRRNQNLFPNRDNWS